MRKNKMMRTAAVLGVATMLTASVLSGTFAKYTTTATGEDSARVAKWGFTEPATVQMTDLFKDAYQTSDGKGVDYDNGANISVKSTTKNTDIIAPGTTGSAQFGFTYTAKNGNDTVDKPEVKYTFSVDTDGSNIADSIKNNTNIKWALDSEDTNAWGDWDKLLASIAGLSGDTTTSNDGTSKTKGTKEYNPGQLPEAFKETDTTDGKNKNLHTVYWKWDFETKSGTDQTNQHETQDSTDTAMGNAETLANVKLKITITATQVN